MAAPRSTADLLLTTHRPAPAADTTKTVAWAYWLDLLTLPPVPAPSPSAYAQRVWNGLLSGWVHSFATVRRPAFNRVSGVTQPGPIADRRAAWLPFAIKESADNTDRGACVSQSPSVESVIPDILSQACPMCSAMPSVLGSIVNPVFNPIFTWATGASEATLVANAGISSIAANSLLTSVKTITAADAFAAAPASTVGMTTNASGAVTATIVTTAQTVRRVMPVMRAMALGPNGSSQPVPLGRVLSATKNEVAEFHANRVFHRALGSDKDETVGWTTPFRFGPIAGGAYVASNDSYLILDNPSANIWRMTAMARYGEPRVLAQWSFLRTPDSLTLDLAPTGEALITVNRENRASTLSVDWSPQGVTQATPFVHAGNVSRGVKLTAHGLEALVKTSTTLKHTATPIVGRPAPTSSASANRALVETALRGLVP